MPQATSEGRVLSREQATYEYRRLTSLAAHGMRASEDVARRSSGRRAASRRDVASEKEGHAGVVARNRERCRGLAAGRALVHGPQSRLEMLGVASRIEQRQLPAALDQMSMHCLQALWILRELAAAMCVVVE